MKRILLSTLCGVALVGSGHAQENYQSRHFIPSTGDTLHYRELSPEKIEKGTSYPLVIFLHGAGERGNDNVSQLTHGSRMFENPVNRMNYPAYVVFPQCPADGYWAYPHRPESFAPDSMPLYAQPTPLITGVAELIKDYTRRDDVDQNRVYVIGMSMGGMATYDLTGRFPELVAAAVPICGTVNPARMRNANGVKFRIFHGDADNVVPVSGSREAYKALLQAGAQVEYFEMPGVNHGSWNPAFNRPDFMEWLFDQRKGEQEEAPLTD